MSSATLLYQQRKSFATLYTGVFLIIITFVIGAFAKPQTAEPPQPALGTGTIPKEQKAVPIVDDAAPIGELKFAQVFNPRTNALDSSQLDGVLAALKSHDIGVRFSVRALANSEEAGNASFLIARMVSTHRWLESLRLPASAYEVQGVLTHDAGAPDLTVSFFAGMTE